MLADLRARAARACGCKCTGCTNRKIQSCFLVETFLVVQPMHLHQHTREASARKSANMVSANIVSVALTDASGRSPESYLYVG